MAFINPIAPIEIKSSISLLLEYFFAIWATNRKFRSIKMFFAVVSPPEYLMTRFFSSSAVSGLGNDCGLVIYPHRKNTLPIILKNPATKGKKENKAHYPIFCFMMEYMKL
jgi:hypothetical protein